MKVTTSTALTSASLVLFPYKGHSTNMNITPRETELHRMLILHSKLNKWLTQMWLHHLKDCACYFDGVLFSSTPTKLTWTRTGRFCLFWYYNTIIRWHHNGCAEVSGCNRLQIWKIQKKKVGFGVKTHFFKFYYLIVWPYRKTGNTGRHNTTNHPQPESKRECTFAKMIIVLIRVIHS